VATPPGAQAGRGCAGHPAGPAQALTDEQAAALAQVRAQPGPFLLYGATGSGKTEVYLQAVAEVLAADPARRRW
jgi:primosomal protein N' (replication factor Y)